MRSIGFPSQRRTFTLGATAILVAALVALPTGPASAVGSPPVAAGDTVSVVDKDAFDVMANDSDVDQDVLTLTTNTQPTHGSATCLATGACTYAANAGYIGPDSFTYTIRDSALNTATATVTMDVTGAPPTTNPPTPVPDEIVTKAGTAVTTNVLANDNVPPGATMVVTPGGGPSHGGVACTSAGSCTYTPTAGFVGYDGFGYEVTDSFGTSHGTALITVVAASAGYATNAAGHPTNAPASSTLVQGDGASWSVGAKSTPAGLPQQYAAAFRPASTTVSLTGPHTLNAASTTRAPGWTATQAGNGLTLTAGATALLGESTTNPLPPPLPPISQGTGGDGHVPIVVGSRVFAFYHHSNPTSVTCIDRTTGQLCPGYPHQLVVASSDIIGPAAVVGSKIYVHALPESVSGYADRAPIALYCWDTNTDQTCGLHILDRLIGTTSDPGGSAPRTVNGKVYLAADGLPQATNANLYCFDPATGTTCPGGPIPTSLPNEAPGYNYDIVTHGTRVFVSQNTNHPEGNAVACIDVSLRQPCTGWSSPKYFPTWNIANHHSAAGVPDGVCSIGLSESQCVLDSTPGTTATMGGWPVVDDYYSIEEEAEFPTRTLFATGLGGTGMGCWDWSTNALCTGGRWTNGVIETDNVGNYLPSAYGATSDGTCAVGLGDPGEVFTVDPAGATPCTSLNAGSVRRIVDLRDQRCDGTVGSATWTNVSVVEADLLAGHDFDALTVTVRDATTDAVLASQQMVGTNGVLSLAGISAVAHPALALDATAASPPGNAAWADGNPPRLILRWSSDPAQVCFSTTTAIDCAQTAPTPIGITATPLGGAPASASLSLLPSPQCRTLTVNKNGNGSGSVTSSPSGINCGAACSARYLSGTPLTLTATPVAGSVFTGWTGGGCTGTGTCNVTLTNDTTVTATFTLLRTITVAKAGSGSGTVSSSPAGINCGPTCSAQYPDGTVVTLTATAAAGSVFTGWTGAACPGTGTCQVTAASNQTVTATFDAVRTLTVNRTGSGSGSVSSSPAGISCGATCSSLFSQGTLVTLTATPSAGSTFTGWSGGGCSGTGTCQVTLNADATVTATFTTISPTLTVTKTGAGGGTVTSSPAGITCGATCSSTFPSGTVVTLTAAPNANSTFAGWSGAGCTGTGTCQVTLSADATVTANFAPIVRTLSVNKAGDGAGTVTSSPAGISCGVTCSSGFNGGTLVTLSAAPAAGSAFTGWSGGGCSGTGTCQVTLNADTTVTATFAAVNPVLTVQRSGTGSGSVSSSPAGITCGATCQAPYAAGTVVTLTATPAGNSTFTGWSGDCSGSGTCQVTMGADRNVTATFQAITPTLTVTRSGNGSGTVTSSPSGISCGATCASTFPLGASVTLTATPAAGSVFTGWTGGGCSGTGSCITTMGADKTVDATFTLTRNLTVTKGGSGNGSVSSSPAGITCGGACSAAFVDGTTVTLTAVPSAGSIFAGWSGGGCSGTATCVVTMSANTSVTATFTAMRTLTVSTAGTGAGTVTSNPAGIACAPTCSTTFSQGTVVTLTATPAAGSVFSGWSLAGCSGTAPCQVTMTADTAVTATFNAQRTLTVTRAGSGSGTVQSSPTGIDCGTSCSHAFLHGTTVTLTATPAVGSVFTGWSGDCSGTATCQLTMNADSAVTATFIVSHTLTVTKAGSGAGSVTSNPPGITCGATCSAAYPAGTSVTLTATPAAGSTFAGWSGGGCSGTGTCTVTMSAAQAVTATFTATNVTLTVSKTGTGTGSVSSSPTGISCGSTCAATFPSGTPVTLTASPTNGSTFAGWSGGGCSGTGTCTVTVASNTTVTASFTAAVNHAPVAKDDGRYFLAPGETLCVGYSPRASCDVAVPANVLANDSDPDGDTLSVAKVVSISFDAREYTWVGDGRFVYRAGAGTQRVLKKTIDYVAVDPRGKRSNVATITVIIGPIAHNDGTYNVRAGNSITIGSPTANHATGVLLNDDAVPGLPLVRAKVTQIDFARGEYTWFGNGAFTYRAGGGTRVTQYKHIWYEAIDSAGHHSDIARITIVLHPR